MPLDDARYGQKAGKDRSKGVSLGHLEDLEYKYTKYTSLK